MAERWALVTGCAGGIGRALVEVFQAAGWKVFGSDIEEAEADAFALADLADPAAIAVLFAAVAARTDSLSALVNNAAAQVCAPLAETSVEDWDRVQAVNLRAPFLCLRHALPLLRTGAAGGASPGVVNVSSVHARATSPEIGAYAASKGGLVALTRAAALELAPENIRVNAVLPGAVDTPMLRAGLARDRSAASPEARFAAFSARHPLGRVARPAEIARAALFLADGERAGYVTGTSLVVDGGVTSRLSTE